MSKRPYQHLPPLEHRPDGSPYRITPPQKRRASGLIRRECCNCEDGNCLALDDGDTCACPQMISFSVCCKWFPLGGLAAGQDAGSGDLPGQGLETLCGVRRCVRPEVQPGQILPGLRRQSSQAAENRK